MRLTTSRVFCLILGGKVLLLSFIRELTSRENSVLCSHMAESSPELRLPTHTVRSLSGLPEPNFQEDTMKIVDNSWARST